MSEPLRLRDSSASPLARALLRSATLDAPPEHSRHKALAAVAVGMSMLSSASSAAAGVSAAAGLGIVKALGIGLVAGAVAAGTATELAKSRSASAPVARLTQPSVEGAERAPGRAAAAPSRAEPALSPAPLPGAQAGAAAENAAESAPAAEPNPGVAVAPLGEVRADERALVQDARRALAGARPALVHWGTDPEAQKRISQPALALALLRRYEEQYPNRKLGPDAIVVRIEALALIGDRASATALAERFVAEHPAHPSVVRVRALVGIR